MYIRHAYNESTYYRDLGPVKRWNVLFFASSARHFLIQTKLPKFEGVVGRSEGGGGREQREDDDHVTQISGRWLMAIICELGKREGPPPPPPPPPLQATTRGSRVNL